MNLMVIRMRYVKINYVCFLCQYVNQSKILITFKLLNVKNNKKRLYENSKIYLN